MFTFDTALTEDVFAKTRLVEHLTEPGLLAAVSSVPPVIASGAKAGAAPKQSLIPLEFTFKEWSFNGTETQDGHVILCGDDWGDSPVPLLDCFMGSQEGINRNDALAVCLVIDAMQAASDKSDAPRHCEARSAEATLIGAGGIYVSADMKRVLFLPPVLFDQVVSMRGAEEYARQQGRWICKALLSKGDRSLSVSEHGEDVRVGEPVEPRNDHSAAFIAASLAYCALTGKPPYDNMDETARDADIYDKQYLPLELAINGVNEELARAIDAALDAPSVLLHEGGGNGFDTPQQRKGGYSTTGSLATLPPINTDVLHRELNVTGKRHDAVPDDEFAERVAEYHKAQEKRTHASRTLRRNRAAIAAAAIGAVCMALAVFFGYRDAMDRPTMQGLDAREVTQVFYRALNEQDVTMVTTAAHGKISHEFGDGLSQVFVSGKMRGMYETGGIVTVEEWLTRYANGTLSNNFGIYGLTNIKIDGAESNADVKVPLRKEHPIPVGRTDSAVTEGNTEIHTVRYYSVHTEGEKVEISCEKHTDRVTLTYLKNKWRITDVVQDSEDTTADFATFRSDLDEAMKAHNSAINDALAELKNKYAWLPKAMVRYAATDESLLDRAGAREVSSPTIAVPN